MPQGNVAQTQVMSVYTMQTCRDEVYTFKGTVLVCSQKTMCFLAAQDSLSWLHWFNQTRVEYSWLLLWCYVDINMEGAILDWKCYTHPVKLDIGLWRLQEYGYLVSKVFRNCGLILSAAWCYFNCVYREVCGVEFALLRFQNFPSSCLLADDYTCDIKGHVHTPPISMVNPCN